MAAARSVEASVASCFRARCGTLGVVKQGDHPEGSAPMCCIRVRPRISAAAGTERATPASWAIAAALASDRPHRRRPGDAPRGAGAARDARDSDQIEGAPGRVGNKFDVAEVATVSTTTHTIEMPPFPTRAVDDVPLPDETSYSLWRLASAFAAGS